MEKNLALKLFAALRKSANGEPLTDAQVRKLTGLCQRTSTSPQRSWRRNA